MSVSTWVASYISQWISVWNQFWFRERDSATLGLMRILVGSMLVYTHLVWTLDLPTFFGDSGILPAEYRSLLSETSWAMWSHFDISDSLAWLYGSHVTALVVFAFFTLGIWTRTTSIVSFLFVVSYANQASGALFGLDQINAFLTLYLAVGNSGDSYSIDQWRRARAGQGRAKKLVNNNIATRLIQLHLCVVYLFAGLGKLQGTYWWNGEAIWGTLASYEYQSLDMTWIAAHMWLVNMLTYVSIAWEVSYAFLVWPKLTRPIVLLLAVLVHGGIGLCMGMMTFGLIMIYANLAFVHPDVVRKVFFGKRDPSRCLG